MTLFRVPRRSRQSDRTGDGLVPDGNELPAGGEAQAPQEESRDAVRQDKLGQVDLKLQNHLALERKLETLRLQDLKLILEMHRLTDLHAGDNECPQNE